MFLLRISNLVLWKNGDWGLVRDNNGSSCQKCTEGVYLKTEDIYPANPKLIYTRISGYGQTGPYAKRPGYASVCEGMGGFRFINGHPGQPPVRPNMSLGDSLAGMHAALGVLLGLVAKNKLSQNNAERTGQVVDVAIYESMLNMMESVIPEYDRFNQVK